MSKIHWVSMTGLATCAVAGSLAFAQHDNKKAASGGVTKAVAVLIPTKNSQVAGKITFMHESDGMHVTAKITGLTPGKHGFHIHEFGDASSLDGMSAGGHFNPMKAMHAGPEEKRRHEGDLGNLDADADGVANYEIVDSQLSFHGAASILGRGVVVHEKADDFKTQPTGNAGGRVAVGVIGVAKGG